MLREKDGSTQHVLLQPGVENVSDHGTIGPRKFWGSQKIFQVHIYKIFQVKTILIKKMDLYTSFLTIFYVVLCTSFCIS